MIKQIYIAGPFFNKEQVKVVEKIKKICDILNLKYFSPKDDNLFKEGESYEKAKDCFKNNLKAMDDSDLIIAIIENYDPGTLYETGYCYSKGKDIIMYSDVENRKLNLMLSFSCIGFSNNEKDLLDKLVRLNSGEYVKQEFKGEHI